MKYLGITCFTFYTEGNIIVMLDMRAQLFFCCFFSSFFFVYRSTTEFCVLKKCLEDANDMSLHNFQYNHFRMSWYSFLNLLDINYSSGFFCEKVPHTVIMDGTTLSFRRNLDTWQPFLTVAQTKHSKQRSGRQVISIVLQTMYLFRFNERVFIPHLKTRKLLHQFTSKGTSQEEFAELCHLITVQGKALVPLFNHLKLQLDSLLEVGGRVDHGLFLAWFESYVLRLAFLDGQEKHFGILFIPLRIIVREIQLSVET